MIGSGRIMQVILGCEENDLICLREDGSMYRGWLNITNDTVEWFRLKHEFRNHTTVTDEKGPAP